MQQAQGFTHRPFAEVHPLNQVGMIMFEEPLIDGFPHCGATQPLLGQVTFHELQVSPTGDFNFPAARRH